MTVSKGAWRAQDEGEADAKEAEAVSSADLSVADEEFVVIVGPTGCGKSTLLNTAAGLLKPAAGNVEIFGTPLAGLNRKAGYLFHDDDDAHDTDANNASDDIDAGAEVYDLADLTPQCGRKGDALKLFLAWHYYGRAGLGG